MHPGTPDDTPDRASLELRIQVAYKELAVARRDGDTLRIELLEDAVNDLLERYRCNT